MASGVPLVTTRVGQATDLVEHGRNAWMVDVDDVDGLVHHAQVALGADGARRAVVTAGRATAEANAYERQDPLWRSFFDGIVDRA
jgi:glycosyltransferase involved in cell wall biosynthesis